MAKKRRSYQINSGDYNIAGGGGGAASGNVRFMRKDTTAVAAGGTGVTYTPGTKQVPNPIKLTFEAGLTVTAAQQSETYVLFEHAFEAPNASVAQVTDADELPTGYGTDLPQGLNINTNSDQGDGSYGYVQFAQSNITASATPGTYKFRYYVDQGGWSRSYIDYEIEVWPQNTTPTQADPNILLSTIIRNTTAPQYLTDTITGSQIVSYTLKNVSGFASGVTPKLDTTDGRVYVENIPNNLVAAATHSFTVEVDLGQYGKIDYAYSGTINYGDPYGARYFGPNNANFNPTGNQDFASTQAQSDAACNPNKSSGALRRVYNVNQDTSPYLHNDGYGCEPVGMNASSYTNQTYYNSTSGYGKWGYMGYHAYNSLWWCSGSNYRVVKFRWTVPSGVTSFCAVAVGGGSGGAYTWASDAGGAGGLAWMNGISCTPGEVYLVYVGLGRQSESNNSSYGAGSSMVVAPNGQTIIFGEGGGYTGYQNSNPNGQRTWYDHTPNGLNNGSKGQGYGGNDSRDGGGAWVNTNFGSTVNGFHYGTNAATYAGGSRVGMGAPGYRGNHSGASSSDRGRYGGGGMGYSYSSTYGYGGGGGVGLDGQGWRGPDGQVYPRTANEAGSGFGGSSGSWTSYNNSSSNYYGAGGGGSGGTRGAWGEQQFTGREEGSNGNRVRVGGTHGGGGGGSGTSTGGGNGAPGGVRIIWGVGADGTPRSFPYTYCSEKPSMKFNGES